MSSPNPNYDPGRVYAGFATLQGGMNSAMPPSLIQPTQCAFARDVTFRDGYPKTRPPMANLPLTFSDSVSEAHCTGKFQGAAFYLPDFGDPSILFSRGGRLFKVDLGILNVISEITPKLFQAVTADFTVPAVNGSVNVSVNDESAVATGDTITIDSGSYLVTNRATDLLVLTYLGGAANATVSAGSVMFDATGNQIFLYETNPDFYDLVFLFQAENYIITLAGQHRPVIFDGSSTRLATVNEIPPGIMGIYLWGRIWITLPDRRTFIAGDLVYGNGLRSSILGVTENTFLNEGGTFAVPGNAGPITSMSALATQDTSLGVGNLLVGTTNAVFSVNTPVDRTTWKNLTYPIQTISLLDYGPQGPRNGDSINGDWWYRSEDGERSFVVARRNMGTPGNTPMSREVQSIISTDDRSLLFYGSQMFFDNKLFCTVSPQRTVNGIVHQGLAIINFDLLSTMSMKLPPEWEGVQTGLNICQMFKGRVNDVERGFAFAMNGDELELWEFLREGYYDTYRTVVDDQTTINRVAIQPVLETRSDDCGDASMLKQLYTGEVFLDELVDEISLTIKYRPDQYPTWTTWATISLCANVSQCSVTPPGQFTCSVWQTRAKQYAARIMLPMPQETCNALSGRPLSNGYEFQFRLEGTGHMRIRRFKPHLLTQKDNMQGDCPSEAECSTLEDCGTAVYGYDSHG